MKVLSKGLWRHQFACGECMAVLLAEEADFHSRQKKDSQELYIACECSECGTEHVPEGKDIPADVRHRIQNRREERPPVVFPHHINPDIRFK